MYKAYKFRLYPNYEQRILLNKSFGCVRFVYNHYLDKAKLTYQICSTFLFNKKRF